MSRLPFLPLTTVAIVLALGHQLAEPQTPEPPSVPTIKTNAMIVIVDVVVTDKNQKPVHNLKQSHFNVLESGTPQTIRNFEEHIYPNPGTPPSEPLPPLPAGVFTNFSPEPPSDAINIILLDTLNTPITNQSYVRSQLKEYLNTAKAGVPTAIFGLTTRLTLLQGFTSNPELLKSIVNKKNLNTSARLDDPVGAHASETMSDQATNLLANDPGFTELVANLQQFEAYNQTAQLEARVADTLQAMNLLARYLSGLPGRKNLIWFSSSFPLNVLPDADIQHPFTTESNFDEQVRETSRLLTAAQVAVYPVHAGGLYNNPTLSASDAGAKVTRNALAASKDQADFVQQTVAENAALTDLAEQTGGHAFINTNGLSQAVSAAIDNGTNFYTLTYSPSNLAQDGKFRKIQVKLQQEGYNLTYRRGYYATDANAGGKPDSRALSLKAPAAKGAPVPALPPDPMRTAMTRGGPEPTQIIFKARILPATTTPEDFLASGTRANPDTKLSHGPYRRYQIDIAADPRPFLYTKTAAGAYRTNLELRVYVFDQDGALITESIATAQSDLTAEMMKQISSSGFPLHQQISVPAKGAYFLRIGIHDLTSDRLGAIEVPIASVKDLPPPPAPVAPK